MVGYEAKYEKPADRVFATVRLRTVKTRRCLSRKTPFAMVLQLVLSAQQKWSRPNGPKRLAQVIEGERFRDGIQEVRGAACILRHQLLSKTTALIRQVPRSSEPLPSDPPFLRLTKTQRILWLAARETASGTERRRPEAAPPGKESVGVTHVNRVRAV